VQHENAFALSLFVSLGVLAVSMGTFMLFAASLHMLLCKAM
jgi:hypothetical protein